MEHKYPQLLKRIISIRKLNLLNDYKTQLYQTLKEHAVHIKVDNQSYIFKFHNKKSLLLFNKVNSI